LDKSCGDPLKGLAPGDVVTVTRIDRLPRSTFDLFAIVKQIVDAGGQFRSLAESWADTATSTGRLMIAVLGVPGAMGQKNQVRAQIDQISHFAPLSYRGRCHPGRAARQLRYLDRVNSAILRRLGDLV